MGRDLAARGVWSGQVRRSMNNDPLYVTRPLLPPLSEFLPYLEKIWASRQLTNAGPFHAELEARLAEYLGVEHLALFTNGTSVFGKPEIQFPPNSRKIAAL